MRALKAARVAVGLVLMLGFVMIFCDYAGIVPFEVNHVLPQTQFGPSVIKVFQQYWDPNWLVILLLTFFVGRVYCSAICPLGVFQDVAWRISSRLGKKKRWLRFSKERRVLRYGVLAVTVMGLVMGAGGMIMAVLDPYSTFGRIFSALFRPLFAWIHNGMAWLGETSGLFSIYTHIVPVGELSVLLMIGCMLLLVVVMSAGWGRAYCNTICPVGTLLGCASRVSLWRMQVDKDLCVKCGKCVRACKAACIDLKNGTVDASRCVMCMNCAAECDEKAIMPARIRPRAKPVDGKGRRRFLEDGALVAGAVGVGVLGGLGVTKVSAAGEKKQGVACPPGAGSVDSFLNACTACALCVSECPGEVLVPSFFAYGRAEGFLRPRMDFHSGFCTFDCVECGKVCPTGAIKELTVEEKKQVQIGKVEFIQSLCVVETDLTACGACAEHCPTQAVRMLPYTPTRKGADGEEVAGLTLPDIREDLCIGCGACEFACPVRPERAIIVNGLAVHAKAKEEEEAALPPPPSGFAF